MFILTVDAYQRFYKDILCLFEGKALAVHLLIWRKLMTLSGISFMGAISYLAELIYRLSLCYVWSVVDELVVDLGIWISRGGFWSIHKLWWNTVMSGSPWGRSIGAIVSFARNLLGNWLSLVRSDDRLELTQRMSYEVICWRLH